MSGQKGSTTRHVHPDRNKKRKFSGNRLTTEDDTEFTSTSWRFCSGIKSNDDYGMVRWTQEVHTYVQKRDETRISSSERHTSDAIKQEIIDQELNNWIEKNSKRKRREYSMDLVSPIDDKFIVLTRLEIF
ncbi:hypothetical protein TNCV_3705651 [Trichonephila clavipes]|nr:hypothetical protein TNCV_3705651 [Trichonephila clavipes]